MSCIRGLLYTLLAMAALQAHSAPACNTRSGHVAAQPASLEDEATPDGADLLLPERAALERQSIKLDLGKDIESLNGLLGRFTNGAAVLGVRLENVPRFDPAKHCNMITLQVYKPKIERLEDGRIRASVDDGRFRTEFEASQIQPPWRMDGDASRRFIWIFPSRFGKNFNGPWSLTQSYDEAFRNTRGIEQRRWIAEAWLNLTLRTYRNRDLVAKFPSGWLPTRASLRHTFKQRAGLDCNPGSKDFVCLAAELIEENEAAPPGDYLSRDAFRTGDALLANSGISTGLRQLDFSTRNEQAVNLASVLMPSTLGQQKLHTSYRQPIRRWHVDQLNKWYDTDGKTVNEELSRKEAKEALLESHVDFVVSNTDEWAKRLAKAYAGWSADSRLALGIVAIDLENVTGFRLRLRPAAQSICDVLMDAVVADGNGRTNRQIVAGHRRRVDNAVSLIKARVPDLGYDWPCRAK